MEVKRSSETQKCREPRLKWESQLREEPILAH
jgi:hypothetical protein